MFKQFSFQLFSVSQHYPVVTLDPNGLRLLYSFDDLTKELFSSPSVDMSHIYVLSPFSGQGEYMDQFNFEHYFLDCCDTFVDFDHAMGQWILKKYTVVDMTYVMNKKRNNGNGNVHQVKRTLLT